MLRQPFKGIEDVLLRDKGHLAVYLREFRLPVCPQIFVPEAFYNLEVTVVARYHQYLFEGLRTLRKGIKLPGIHAAGNHKVTRAFRRAFNQKGRLHFYEVLSAQVLAGFQRQVAAKQQVALQGLPPQVQVAVAHAQVVAAVRIVFNGEWGYLGRVEHAEIRHGNLYVARGAVGVLVGALAYLAGRCNHKFTPQLARTLTQRRIVLLVKYQLRDAVAVAKVHKGHAAKVAANLYPAAQAYFFSNVAQTQLTTCMRTVHIFYSCYT